METVKTLLCTIKRLVGDVEKEQLRYVDSFVGGNIGLFMPVGGPCFYAVTPRHRHPSYMFVLQFDDTTSIKIDKKIVKGRHGTLFALSPEIPHQELPSETPPRYIAIFIGKELFESQLREYPLERPVEFRGESFDADPELLKVLKKFMLEAENRIPGSGALLNALGIEICHLIIRSIFGFQIERDRISTRLEIDRTIEHMHSRLDQKMTIGDLSRIANMSPSHFSRIFRCEMGATPMGYLNRLRMERAKKLLAAGERSITNVAFDCGFSSSAYFSTSFFREYHISPSDFRRGLNGKGNKQDS